MGRMGQSFWCNRGGSHDFSRSGGIEAVVTTLRLPGMRQESGGIEAVVTSLRLLKGMRQESGGIEAVVTSLRLLKGMRQESGGADTLLSFSFITHRHKPTKERPNQRG